MQFQIIIENEAVAQFGNLTDALQYARWRSGWTVGKFTYQKVTVYDLYAMPDDIDPVIAIFQHEVLTGGTLAETKEPK